MFLAERDVVCEVVPFAERECGYLRAFIYMRNVPSTVHEVNNIRQLSICGTQRSCVARLVKHRPCLNLLKVLVGAAGQRRCMPQVFAYLSALLCCEYSVEQMSLWKLYKLH